MELDRRIADARRPVLARATEQRSDVLFRSGKLAAVAVLDRAYLVDPLRRAVRQRTARAQLIASGRRLPVTAPFMPVPRADHVPVARS
jgi:hypothetical protein